MSNPREDITLDPEFAMIIFGDGHLALSQGAKEEEDDKGREIVNFTVKPSAALRKRYDIRDERLNNHGNIQDYKVLKKDLISLNQFDDANRRILYIKTFEHNETEVSKIAWTLRKRLEEMEIRVIVLEGELIWLSEQLQLAKTNPAEFNAQGLEMLEKMSSHLMGLMSRKPEKDNLQ